MAINEKIKVNVEFEYPITHVVEWGDANIIINENLSLADMLSFTSYVSSACFDSDTREFLPEVFDFAVKCAMVEFYTNIELPEEAVDKYTFVFGTNIAGKIREVADCERLDALVDSTWIKVKHLAQANIERVRKEIDNVAQSLSDLEEKMDGAMMDFDNDAITSLANVLAGGAIDEEKLVKAIVESGSMSKVEK